jgi:hypothetical protein
MILKPFLTSQLSYHARSLGFSGIVVEFIPKCLFDGLNVLRSTRIFCFLRPDGLVDQVSLGLDDFFLVFRFIRVLMDQLSIPLEMHDQLVDHFVCLVLNNFTQPYFLKPFAKGSRKR